MKQTDAKRLFAKVRCPLCRETMQRREYEKHFIDLHQRDAKGRKQPIPPELPFRYSAEPRQRKTRDLPGQTYMFDQRAEGD